MTQRAYEIIDHTADVGIIAHGANIEQLFCHAALALFSLITDVESVKVKLQRQVKIASGDNDSLLVEWLNELIYLFDTEHVLFSKFNIEALHNNQLQASCLGEDFDPLKHTIKREVKAATYHMVRINRDSRGYEVRVIFDI